MVSFRVALSGLLSTVVLASCPFTVGAQKRNDPVSVANDEAAFNKLRAEIARQNEARVAASRPVQVARHANVRDDDPCRIKPVMTDAEINACRRK